MSSAEEPREREQVLRAIDEQLDALGGDATRGRSLVERWIGGADRDALLADLEATAATPAATHASPQHADGLDAFPVDPSPLPRERTAMTHSLEVSSARADAAHVDALLDVDADVGAAGIEALGIDEATAPSMRDAGPDAQAAVSRSPDAYAAPSEPADTHGDFSESAHAAFSESPDTADTADTPMHGVPAAEARDAVGSGPSWDPTAPSDSPSAREPIHAVAPPPLADSIPPGHIVAPIEPAPPVGVAVEPPAARSERPSRGPSVRRKSALPPPVRRADPPKKAQRDGRVAIPSEPPVRASEAPAARTSSPPRGSVPPLRSEPPPIVRPSPLPPSDDGGLSLDLGEIGPAEGTRVAQDDLPAETTQAHAVLSSIEPPATERGSVVPAQHHPSERPPMGSDPFAAARPASVAPPPLADLFGDADDVLFGPEASQPLSVAAPPPSEPVRGSLEVDLDELDSELDSFIEEAPESRPPAPPPFGQPRFTASDTVMAKPFEVEEGASFGALDEVEPTIVGHVEQFEELGMGLSEPEPGPAPPQPAPSQPPLGGLRPTGAPPPTEPPRSKGFLKKLFGGK